VLRSRVSRLFQGVLVAGAALSCGAHSDNPDIGGAGASAGGAAGNGGNAAGAGGGAAGGGPASCEGIAQCGLPCPDGLVNPTDADGCQHTCECVNPGTPPGSLQLYDTCGDPVCRGYTGGSGEPLCSTEAAGGPCNVEGATCDPRDDCNSLLVCASSDPKLRPGGCPISRRSTKQDIHYLSDGELAQYQRELLAMKLASWRYRHDPAKQRLGIIIDDNEQSAAVDAPRDQLDLYSYTSMVVAALQMQAREIKELQGEIDALKKARASGR
jgi:hypothetical protein